MRCLTPPWDFSPSPPWRPSPAFLVLSFVAFQRGEIFRRSASAEMAETCYRNPVAAVLCGRGFGIVDGLAKHRSGGYNLGAYSRGRGVLAGDLSASSQTDAGLCLRPRIDSRSL